MAGTFIPPRDADALVRLQAFSINISAAYGSYGLGKPDADTIASVVGQFAAAFAAASNPATRTPGAVNLKAQCRVAAEAVCRLYATQIKHNAGVDDSAKVGLGIPPVNNNPRPRQCPLSPPLLKVIAATPLAQTLRYADSLTPDSRRKPFAADCIQIFRAVDTENAATPDQAQFYGSFTKNPIPVSFESAHRGKQATYFARWAGKQGQVSEWSGPASLTIAA